MSPLYPYSPTFVVSCFLILAALSRVRLTVQVILICLSLLSVDAEHLLKIDFLSVFISAFENTLLRSIGLYLIQYFFILCFGFYLWIPDINILVDAHLEKISPLCGLLYLIVCFLV